MPVQAARPVHRAGLFFASLMAIRRYYPWGARQNFLRKEMPTSFPYYQEFIFMIRKPSLEPPKQEERSWH